MALLLQCSKHCLVGVSSLGNFIFSRTSLCFWHPVVTCLSHYITASVFTSSALWILNSHTVYLPHKCSFHLELHDLVLMTLNYYLIFLIFERFATCLPPSQSCTAHTHFEAANLEMINLLIHCPVPYLMLHSMCIRREICFIWFSFLNAGLWHQQWWYICPNWGQAPTTSDPDKQGAGGMLNTYDNSLGLKVPLVPHGSDQVSDVPLHWVNHVNYKQIK